MPAVVPRSTNSCMRTGMRSSRSRSMPVSAARRAIATRMNEQSRRMSGHGEPGREIVPSAYIGEAEIAALEEVGQLLVIETEKRQDRRMQVVHVDLVLGGVQ